MSDHIQPIGDADFRRIWNQDKIPVLLRPTGDEKKLRARLPYAVAIALGSGAALLL